MSKQSEPPLISPMQSARQDHWKPNATKLWE